VTSSFADLFDPASIRKELDSLSSVTAAQVRSSLSRGERGRADFLNLISPAAEAFLEPLAVEAERLTRRRFGRVVQLYIPLYLSSECCNSCSYCGFRRDRTIERRTLSPEEIRSEADEIRAMGFSHLLLVSGTAPKTVTPDFLASTVSGLKQDFSSISLEVAPLSAEEYALIREAGCDGVTLYQETYDPDLYASVHPSGDKRDYAARLDAPDRMGAASIRRINIGALLGLGDWRFEALSLGRHLDHLTKQWWSSYFSLSFPRISDCPDDFSYTPVTDRSLVQMVLAFRLCYPDLNLVLSTRESPLIRKNLARIAVTQLSAGSRTAPGGYGAHSSDNGQFAVCDERPAEEVASELRSLGLEPVWKDWDRALS
jgi:2-iminoacetate synthase